MSKVVFLGPQRFQPSLPSVIEELEIRKPLAAVTAGWQERESEVDELHADCTSGLMLLELYARYDDVLQRDPELAEALQERQSSLRELQQLYRLRLHHGLTAVRELAAMRSGSDLLQGQQQAALRGLRSLDRRHLDHLRRLHREFDERWRPRDRPVVRAHRRELAAVIGNSGGLVVAGGHVGVLLTRMRLFDPVGLIDGQPIIAWSAGAMALTDRVILFHDHPPQGAGDPEVFEVGLGPTAGLVALPHGRKRLQLNDPTRVALFAQRFSPGLCVLLDRETRCDWEEGRWKPVRDVRRLARQGRLREVARPW